MMRRFSRKRKNGAGGGQGAIDGMAAMAKILESGLLEAQLLVPVPDSGVPESLAVIGRGERADGSVFRVSFSPRSATEALLGAMAANAASPDTERGPILVVAPQWPAAARRVLSLMGQAASEIEAVAAPGLSDGRVIVEPEPEAPILAISSAQLAARMISSESRAAFKRASAALEGLAAKHGGSVRVGTDRLELVVLARRVASIRTENDAAHLEVQIGGKSSTPLSGSDLAGALDGLEGQIRRRLNDRKVREGEEGLRGRVLSQLASSEELRGLQAWPQPGLDLDDIDGVAVNAEGEPVVIAVREEFDWHALAAVLEAVAPLRALFPVLFAETPPPLRLGAPRLLLVAKRFGAGFEKALDLLTLAYELREVSDSAGPALGLSARASGEGGEVRPARRGRSRGGRSGRKGSTDRDGADEEAGEESRPSRGRALRPSGEGGDSEIPKGPRALLEASVDDIPTGPRALEAAGDSSGNGDAEDAGEEAGRGRGRRRRRSRRSRGASEEVAESAESSGAERQSDEEGRSPEGAGRRRSRPFEEVSLMDLDDGPDRGDREDESGQSSERGRGRSRRGRGRGKGRGRSRRDGAEAQAGSDDGADASDDDTANARIDEEDLVDSDDLEEILARLADDGPDFDPGDSVELKYEDDEEASDEDGGSDDARLEAEKRRRAKKGADDESEGDDRPAPRRRSAIVVHADRDSVLAAMLLARDIRQLDGIWVYPQSELMTFFRSVATDLRDETPIFMIGFSPSPARDVVQAASLYRGRLTWFDRQPWPPEDRMALAEALGEDAIHGGEENDSCLPLVLETCSRRSRFSDKLVDLATGRFTQHDFERWGRLWWWRAGEIASKSGDIRADLAPILSGRPSDLTKEAATIDLPPVPKEVDYVRENDFRLVHFGGYVMVVVPVEGDFDVHLTARIARERYQAGLSLAYAVGGEVFAFSGDEGAGKRALDYLAVVEHLVNKLEWAEPRADADHVARFRVRGLAENPERMDELIGEIAMGRTLLER